MSTTPTLNPYIVGGWVTNENFYGRAALRYHLLHGPNNYLWVVGTRRIGKTSLLRQLAVESESLYLPVYWDMQGCTSGRDLGYELFYALEDQAEQFSELGLDLSKLEGLNVRALLRRTCRAAATKQRRLLLLIDEPETLIEIAQTDAVALRRLRSALQRPSNLRVILTSTKHFTRLHDVSEDWLTSSFLQSFTPHSLAGLSLADSAALIRQSNSGQAVEVSDAVIAAIQHHTNNHPYLVQWLCYRLLDEHGSLRMPSETDLVLDSMLDMLFNLQFKHLSPTERGAILYMFEAGSTDAPGLAQALTISPREANIFLYALNSLGYTRRVEASNQVTIGNYFLRTWLETNADDLTMADAEISDASVQVIGEAGQQQEAKILRRQLQKYRVNLARLEVEGASYGIYPPLRIQNLIDAHTEKIGQLEVRLDTIQGG